jgi:hypothetical protein
MATYLSFERFVVVLRRCLGAIVLFALTATPALAQTNLITNGNFTTLGSAVVGKQLTATGLTGWTNNDDTASQLGYNFLYDPATADIVADSSVPLWGTRDGGVAAITASPAGGYFIGMDGAYEQGSLSQTMNGLVVGTSYYVSYWWAGAQQYNFNGQTTEQFAAAVLSGTSVLAGNATCTTTGVTCSSVATDANHSFTGWNRAGFTFVATATQETLSFLAIGTPAGEPPFSLLSGVSVQLDEPASAVLLVGVAALGFLRLRRQKAA